MPTASELRAESRRLREAAEKETNQQIRQGLAARALELAQLAEQIERRERGS